MCFISNVTKVIFFVLFVVYLFVFVRAPTVSPATILSSCFHCTRNMVSVYVQIYVLSTCCICQLFRLWFRHICGIYFDTDTRRVIQTQNVLLFIDSVDVIIFSRGWKNLWDTSRLVSTKYVKMRGIYLDWYSTYITEFLKFAHMWNMRLRMSGPGPFLGGRIVGPWVCSGSRSSHKA